MVRVKLAKDKAGRTRYVDRDTGRFLKKSEYLPVVEKLRRNAYIGAIRRSDRLSRSAATVALKGNVSEEDGVLQVADWFVSLKRAKDNREAAPGFPTSP